MALALQRKERKFWLLLQATRVSQKGVSRRGAEAEVEEAANARVAESSMLLQKSAAADIGKRWGEASCKTGMWRDNIGDITTGAFTLGAVIGGGSDPPARSAGGSGDVAGAANACKTGMWREDLGELTTSSFKLSGAAAGEEQAQRRPRDDKPPEGSVLGMDLDVDINGGLGGSGSGDRGGQTLTITGTNFDATLGVLEPPLRPILD